MAKNRSRAVPERVPVAVAAVERDPVGLLGVTVVGGQQRHVLGVPALVQELHRGIVGGLHGLRRAARDEPDRGSLAAQKLGGVGGQGREHVADLAAVAQVGVQRQGDQAEVGAVVAVEDSLLLVGEHRDPCLVRVAQGGQERGPPGMGAVLGLVDDQGVEALLVGEGRASSVICAGIVTSQYSWSRASPISTPHSTPRAW